MIELTDVSKTFRVMRRNSGLGEALKALFHREYTEIRALDGISFRINDGEMVGLIGPNGAGKSSTVKVMSGILTPDHGECTINGRTPWRERKAHTADIGVVFGQRSQLWWDVPVIDTFELLRDIYKLPDATYRDSLEELVTMFELSDIIKTPARQLSLGQRMRCEVAASLLHRPSVLFLDEPTIGLDAVSKIAVREFVKRINRERGTTVLLTTHDMQDVEALTERILLIGKGRILLDGALSELKARGSSVRRLTVFFSDGSISPIDGVEVQNCENGHAVCLVDTDRTSVSNVIAQLSNTLSVTDLSVEGVTADELVVSLYKEFAI